MVSNKNPGEIMTFRRGVTDTMLAGFAAVLLSTAAPLLMEPAAAAAVGEDSLTEIVATAERRSENLERTPVAVSVVSAEELAKDTVLSYLRTEVPGLTVRETIGANALNYSLRGPTVDAYSGSDPAVLPYINEVHELHYKF
jgi:iron complex outermembrane receptor protein